MSEKIIGYILLFSGIMLMIFSGYNIYGVFTGQSKPYNIITVPAISLKPNSLLPSNLPVNIPSNLPPELANQLTKSTQMPDMELLSSESLSSIFNLSAYFFLMSFLLNFGFKFANLGINMVRPIEVKLTRKIESPLEA